MKKSPIILAAILAAAAPLQLSAVDLYWDLNLDSAGAGPEPSGFWDTSSENWNTDPDGLSLPGFWTPGETAFFSAGNDATGAYTVTISGTQTAAGINIEDGTVIFPSGTAAVGTGAITVNAGAALSINSSLRLNGPDGKVTLNGGMLIQTNPGNAGSFIPASMFLEIGEAGGTISYASSGAGTVSIYGGVTGTITGSGTLTKTGPGEFRYQGLGLLNTTFTKLVVLQGLYRLGFNQGVQQAQGGEHGFGAESVDTFLPDAITLDGGSIGTSWNVVLHENRGITLGPTGGIFNTSAGSMTVPGAITGSGNLTNSGAGTAALVLSGANTYTGTTTVTAGTLRFAKQVSLYNNTPASWTDTNIIVNNSATLALNVGGPDEFTAADVAIIAGLGSATGGFANGARLGLDTTNAAGGNFPYSSVIANPNGGANALGLTKFGTNTLTLTGANTYTGRTALNGGVLSIESIANGGQPSNIGASTNAAANLAFLSSSTLQYTGPDATTDRNFTISGGVNATFDISANSLTITGGTPNTTGRLTKTGAGTLILGGANVHAGDTTISGGTLRPLSNTALGFGGTLISTTATVGRTVVSGSTAAATLDLSGITVNEPITLDGGANGASLINSNTSTAATINNGVAGIQFSNAGAGFTAPIDVVFNGGGGSGAAATATASTAGTMPINGVTMTAPGTGYTSAPDVEINGSTGGGAVATAVLSSVTLTDTNNNIGGAGDLTIAAAIGESAPGAGFSKIGSGTLTLAGSNTYTGDTTVTAGTLEFATGQTLSGLIIGDGAVVLITQQDAVAAAHSDGAADGLIGSGFSVQDEEFSIASTASAQAVPEPGAFSLLTIGALGLLGRRRRQV